MLPKSQYSLSICIFSGFWDLLFICCFFFLNITEILAYLFLGYKRFNKSCLQPYSIHLESCFSIFKIPVVNIILDFFKTSSLEQRWDFFFWEIISSCAIMFHVEMIFQLSSFFTWEVKLSKIILSIVSEVNHTAWFHPSKDLINHFLVVFWAYRAENKNESNNISGRIERFRNWVVH